MDVETPACPDIDARIAQRLKQLRMERSWSLDELAKRSSVSRATLSRLENADVSPTANVLGKLCAAFGLPVSRLMFMVEAEFEPFIPAAAQPIWHDPSGGFHRRSVSPPSQKLAGEVVECTLKPGTQITYERSPRPGLEHHIYLQQGRLHLTVDGQHFDLNAGDCVRYQLFTASEFRAGEPDGAKYFLFMV